jgi:hypothetical protein
MLSKHAFEKAFVEAGGRSEGVKEILDDWADAAESDSRHRPLCYRINVGGCIPRIARIPSLRAGTIGHDPSLLTQQLGAI